MNEKNHWEELIDRHLRGELSESEKEDLAKRLDSDSAARKEFVEHAQWDTMFAEALRETAPIGEQPDAERTAEVAVQRKRTLTTTFTKILLAIAAVVIIVLTAGLYFQITHAERRIAQITQRANDQQWIATITGLSGSLIWIGDGGRIVRELSEGTQLSGGTIEGVAPDSWFELEFNDGSAVMISGNSMLTFSDDGQKKLHLKEGTFSANVTPQPPGKPMLVHTRTATLEVVGTQFNVNAGLFSTTLNVSQGKVLFKRLSDGNQVDVAAGYRVVAAPDHEMLLTPVPNSVGGWNSQLDLGADRTMGRWSPGTNQEGARLSAVPFTTEEGKTIYTASLAVSSGANPPVVLQPDSRIRVRGYVRSSSKIYFGMTVRQASGDFAGRFQTIRPAEQFPGGQAFEVVLDLRDYQLDPSLTHIRDRLPSDPSGLIVDTVWCHTLYDPAGLAITEVELVPPADHEPSIRRTGK